MLTFFVDLCRGSERDEMMMVKHCISDVVTCFSHRQLTPPQVRLWQANCHARTRLLWQSYRVRTKSRTRRWSSKPLSCCGPSTSPWWKPSVKWMHAWSGGRWLETRTPNDSENVYYAVLPTSSSRRVGKPRHRHLPGKTQRYWAQGHLVVRRRSVELMLFHLVVVVVDHRRRCRELLLGAAWAEQLPGLIAPRDRTRNHCLVHVCTGMNQGRQTGWGHLLGAAWWEQGFACLAIGHPHVVAMDAVRTSEWWAVNEYNAETDCFVYVLCLMADAVCIT